MSTFDDLGNVNPDDGDSEIVGPHGEPLFNTDPAADGSGGFNRGAQDALLYGVYNAAFTQAPPSPNDLITAANPLPYWALTLTSGVSIDALWVDASSVAHGGKVRLTVNTNGNAGDDCSIRQYVPVPGSFGTIFGYSVGATFYCPAGILGTAGLALAYVTAQFVKADGVTATGSATTTSTALTNVNGVSNNRIVLSVYPNNNGVPPADAAFLRLDIGLKRDTAAVTAAGAVEVFESFVVTTPPVSVHSSVTPTAAPSAIAGGTGPDGTAEVQLISFPGGLATFGIGLQPQGASGPTIWFGSHDVKLYRAAASVLATAGAMAWTGILSVAIAANQNNWAPAGIATCSIITLDLGGAGRTITGISATGFVEGQRISIMPFNTSAFNLTLTDKDALSLAGNRFSCPGGVNLTVRGTGGIDIIYLPTSIPNNPFRVVAV